MNKQKKVINLLVFLTLFSFCAFSKGSADVAQKDNWWSTWDFKSRPDLTKEYSMAKFHENCRLIDGEIVIVVSKQEWIQNGFPEDDYEPFKETLQKINETQQETDSEPWDFQKEQDEYFERKASQQPVPELSAGYKLDNEGRILIGTFNLRHGHFIELMDALLKNLDGVRGGIRLSPSDQQGEVIVSYKPE